MTKDLYPIKIVNKESKDDLASYILKITILRLEEACTTEGSPLTSIKITNHSHEISGVSHSQAIKEMEEIIAKEYRDEVIHGTLYKLDPVLNVSQNTEKNQ